MFGHGLNKLTWAKFVERFQVGRIVEVQINQGVFEFYKFKPFCQVYASTEGAAGAINTQGKVGAVGFIPLTIPVSPLGIVKMDEDGEVDYNNSVKNSWEITISNLKVLRSEIPTPACAFAVPLGRRAC